MRLSTRFRDNERIKAIVVAVAVLGSCAAATASDAVPSAIACSADNDLLGVLSANRIASKRYGSAAEAVRAADGGVGVLILADAYPIRPTALDPAPLRKKAGRSTAFPICGRSKCQGECCRLALIVGIVCKAITGKTAGDVSRGGI